MKHKIKNSKSPRNKTLTNSFDIGNGIGIGNYPMAGIVPGFFQGTAPNTQPFELAFNLSYNLISLQWLILTYAYVAFGVFRTLVDRPVKDAMKGGIRIKSSEVDEQDILKLERKLKKMKYWRKVQSAMRWSRLYGGAGLIINVNEDYSKPFDPLKLKENANLDFKVVDRWQVAYNGMWDKEGTMLSLTGLPNGRLIHPSRMVRVNGPEAPYQAAMRLQGWGMSVIECVIRSFNTSCKHENVAFEYLDEFKVDIWKVKDFNANALSKAAAGALTQRFRLAQQMKNFLNAVVLDSEDDFEQKQPTIAGLADIMEHVMVKMAADAQMPMSKIYGLSSQGFASGEDDLENYAAIVEDIRMDIKDVIEATLPAICMIEWGYVPDDLDFEFEPARTLTAKDKEEVLTSKFNRHQSLYNSGIYNPQEYCQALKRDGIMTIQTEVSDGAEPQPPMLSQIHDNFDRDEEGDKD